MAEEIIAMTMKYRPVPILNVVAATPELPQGEVTENPMPAPNERRTSVNARDVTAPARTAAQDTLGTDGSTMSACTACRIACSIFFSQQPRLAAQKMLKRPVNAQSRPAETDRANRHRASECRS